MWTEDDLNIWVNKSQIWSFIGPLTRQRGRWARRRYSDDTPSMWWRRFRKWFPVRPSCADRLKVNALILFSSFKTSFWHFIPKIKEQIYSKWENIKCLDYLKLLWMRSKNLALWRELCRREPKPKDLLTSDFEMKTKFFLTAKPNSSNRDLFSSLVQRLSTWKPNFLTVIQILV